MTYILKKLEKSQVELKFSLTTKDFDSFKNLALEKIGKEIKIDGFRKGHIPIDVVSKNVAQSNVYSQAIDIAINKSLRDAIKKEGLNVLGSPKVEIKSNDPIEFIAIMDVLPDIDLGDYDKVKLQVRQIVISKKEVDFQIENFREKLSEKKEKKQSAKKGDIVLVDFEGFDENGDCVKNTKSTNYEMEIGSGKMIPGFEEEVIGMSKGEEKDFQISFPKDYHVKQMAGRKYKFHIVVNKVSEKVLPKVDENFVSKLYGSSKTVEFLREDIEKYLKFNKERQNRSELEEELLNNWSKKIVFEVPQSEVDKKLEFMIDNVKMGILKQGMPWEHYLKHISKSEDDIKKELAGEALENVKKSFIMQEVIKKEDIKVVDDEVSEQIKNIEAQAKANGSVFNKNDYLKGSKNYLNIASNLLISKVFNKYLPNS